MHKTRLLQWLGPLALLLAPLPGKAHQEAQTDLPAIRAVRLETGELELDGRLQDPVWQRAPKASGFTQRDPDEGQPASEETTVQLAYDDEALYIGVMCYDSEPEEIVSRLARRDRWVESDRISVNLNPHHDHQTGYFFSVGPSGWMMDGVLFDDTSEDDTWDGVWEVKTSRNDEGWCAEYRIPYHVLRFSPQAEYTWGINILRDIVRKQERDFWILVPKAENGWVSRFGHVEGIAGIHPPAHLEILPFGLGRSTFQGSTDGGNDLFSTFGLDLRYGLASNISLNATVNPDFGQVEADPAVLNLGVFETFFRERRPFFVEGSAIFNAPWPDIVGINGPATLFHSRRIGKQPGRFEPESGDLGTRPDGTTILGATKLTGKTARGMSFGLITARTGAEHAPLEQIFTDPITGEETSETTRFRLESPTNYLAGRLQQDLGAHSTAGFTLTAVQGSAFESSYVGSMDGHFKWRDNAYRVYTRLSGSRTGQEGRQNGYEGLAYFSKFSGWFGGQAYVDTRSPNFDTNELGFMNRNDRIQTGAHIYAQIQQPWALARRSGFNINTWSHWNYDRVGIYRGVNFNNWHNLKNYWWLNFGINRAFAAQDDLVTRGGPLMKTPANINFWFNIGTDDSKPFSLSLHTGGSRDDGGKSYNRRIGINPEWRPASNIEIDIEPSYRIERNYAQWIENVDSDGDDQDDRYIFGDLRSQVLDVTIRTTWSFTPGLSLQLYAQPFVSVGNYRQIKELARPESYAFTPYDGLTDNPDFSSRSLRSNLVLRWEWRPGSTFYAVWSQSRSRSFDRIDPDFDPWGDAAGSFGDSGKNILLIKYNYWLGL